ncbi:MAG: excinuclease ABC subunit UvrC [Rhodospirillaceae bacterium]|nr:excinuclease ABC subunit UvrC [Rhodospirillaceae bacterium]
MPGDRRNMRTMAASTKPKAAREERAPAIPAATPDGAGAGALPASLANGAAYLKAELSGLSTGPGVYRMIDRRGQPLYVGKARSLRRRVASYTAPAKLPERLRRMVAETALLEIVETHTEVEALLLESNLIKRLRPRYNILLRDDKSFPYIRIGKKDLRAAPEKAGRWPRIAKYRGSRREPGSYYGPFASAGAVNRTLNALERAFLLRSCSDSMFSSRTRPCLLFQIKRCCAPCVGRIGEADYDALVAQAEAFLSGRDSAIQRDLAGRMEAAAEALEFETAAYLRDRIQALAHIQARQDINLPVPDDADIVAAWREGEHSCIQVFFFRAGRNYGNRAYYPRHDKSADDADILAAFLGQFYDNKPPPRLILTGAPVADAALLGAALSEKAGRKVELAVPRRGNKRKLIEHALANARAALTRRLSENASQRQLLEGVADAFGLDAQPERIEVYDNSHISGSDAVGGMIVAGPDGLVKNAYRKFNIRSTRLAPGDDYAMMREVLTRRFGRALREDPARETGAWPDLVLVDGGRGQLGSALDALAELGIDDLPVVGVSKGPDRNAGRETFHTADGRSFGLPPNDPVLYFLQRLRDEAHRYAIGAHRTRRANARTRSALDDIPGVGARRKRALLNHFGSGRNIERAGLSDLETVDGISRTVARTVFDWFHAEA